MLVYLDTVICIYTVEGPPPFMARARARMAALLAAGDRLAVSDLTWLEARVKPIQLGDPTGLADIEAFLTAGHMVRVLLPFAVYDRACQIRADHRYKLGDAIHLAAAIENGCSTFLTYDFRLSRFPGIPVEVLP
jgi:predicted nucleic acid-binding protein